MLVSSLLFGKCGEFTKVQTTAVKCNIIFLSLGYLLLLLLVSLSCVLVPWSGTVGVSDAECKTGHV